MVPKMVFPRYPCGFQRHTIIDPTPISNTIFGFGAKSGDVLPARLPASARANPERQRTIFDACKHIGGARKLDFTRGNSMPDSVNVFGEPQSYDHTIYKKLSGAKVGEIRVKPSSILWKPKGAHKYSSVSLEDFAEWMKSKQQVSK
jgi:hypothetical protein